MGTAPRKWQTTLANLSVTSKVGIVLLLPVLLASAFAILRINDQLARIAELNAATEQARIIRPMLTYCTATNQVALVASTSVDRASNPAVDQAVTKYEQAMATLQAALESSRADKKVTAQLSESLTAGRLLDNDLRMAPPVVIGQQADAVANRIGNAIAVLPALQEVDIQRYFLQLDLATIARRVFVQEDLVIATNELASSSEAARSRLLTNAGGELVMVGQYGLIQPESAVKSDVLMAAVRNRISALNQLPTDPTVLPMLTDSLRTSLDAYDEVTAHLVDLIDGTLATRITSAHSEVLLDVAIVVLTLLSGLALALGVARSLVLPVRRLRRDALLVAHEDLPAELTVVREGGATPDITPVDVHTTEEVGQLARAVDDMHRQALHLAAGQARLRLQISNMFETLSRRSQSLVEQQLSLIEDLERDEENSQRLDNLFRLDHLATRMRRNGDNLLVLAGTTEHRGHLPPVPLSDILWSGISQVEDYQRVDVGTVPNGIVPGEPAVDIEHLLAELIDNALRYSPPESAVAVAVSRAVDGGYLVEVTDRGLGMSAADLAAINERLASGGDVTIETARRMGLFVVGRLAARHAITVSLRRTSILAQQPGITASVHLPGTLVSPLPADPTANGGLALAATVLHSEAMVGEPRALAAVDIPATAMASAQPAAGAPVGLAGATLPQRHPIIADTEEQPSWLGAEDTASVTGHRFSSEWLAESHHDTASQWSSPADIGWLAAAQASAPQFVDHTTGGLPIRQPGAQLVPGGLTTDHASRAPDPEEIRNNLSRHLSGVRSGRADARNNDGGHP